MLFINRLLLIGLLCVGITAATTAQAAVQLFQAEWYTNSFGNQCDIAAQATTVNGGGTPASQRPYCTKTGQFFTSYSNWNLPQNQNCNPNQPRCPISSTPTSMGNFNPLGGDNTVGLFCQKYTIFNPGPRPANGATLTTGGPNQRPTPPLYRNLANFTPGGQPRATQCTEMSTGFTTQNKGRFGFNKGRVHVGDPIDGTWNAITTGAKLGQFSIPQAPPHNHRFGLEQSGIAGSFTNIYPYIYSYTYINFRNAQGAFGPGQGVGSFTITYGGATVNGVPHVGFEAIIKQKQRPAAGGNKFGGTMEMLGALTTKVCYYFAQGCSLGQNRWRYDAIGASGVMTAAGVVTKGYLGATYKAHYYNSVLMAQSTITVIGSRFPWTTGSITLAATGRGPGDTVHYAHGYDNRNTTTSSGKGTIQLVSPIMTRWSGPGGNLETGGIATLKIKFVPEPQTWAMLIAGLSLLGVGARMRGR
jgi:hypothetical protein